MNISISLLENGLSGFLMKDITGISVTKGEGFLPFNHEISSLHYRVLDVVFLDFVTYNKLGSPTTEPFTYIIKNNLDYSIYSLEYNCSRDGWYTINHLVIPTYLWFKSIDYKYFPDGTYYFYDKDREKYTKVIKNNSNILEEDIDDPYLIYVSLSNPSIMGVLEDIFLIGRLERCFEEKVKKILYSKLYTKCESVKSSIYRDRDIVWMALEIIKYLIRYCNYYEALRILEKVDHCNGFCNDIFLKDNININTSCNCH